MSILAFLSIVIALVLGVAVTKQAFGGQPALRADRQHSQHVRHGK